MDSQALRPLNNQGQSEEPDDLEIVNQLGRISLFRQFPQEKKTEYLRRLSQFCSLVPIGRNQEIITKGQVQDSLFLLINGEIEVIRYTKDGMPFHVVFLTDQQGDFFGEVSLIWPESSDSTYMAHSEGRLLVLSRDNFTQLCTQYPSIGVSLLLEISQILEKRLKKIREERDMVFNALLEEMSG